MATAACGAELMKPAEQNALVQQYCAVCHTDAMKSGGLSLQHYDAARTSPALAAMMLSKMQNGAMGAAGKGVPSKEAQAAWSQTTTAQAETAREWSVERGDGSLTVSIVAYGPQRRVYRLAVTCEAAGGRGEISLAWSPSPQTGRPFSASSDGQKARILQLIGGDEAWTELKIPLPEKTLVVADIFPGDRIEFRIGDLDPPVHRELGACFR